MSGRAGPLARPSASRIRLRWPGAAGQLGASSIVASGLPAARLWSYQSWLTELGVDRVTAMSRNASPKTS